MTHKRISEKGMRETFVRSNLHQASWNYERMQALGFLYSMVPTIRELYPDANDPNRKDAIARHLEFFNTQPFVTAPILGIVLAMEEQRAAGADIDDAAINGIKVGMMGPLAGVGDPIFWGTLRPVVGAFAAGFAMQGSIMGPLIFFVVFNAVRLGFRAWGLKYGYEKGGELIKDVSGGVLRKITVGASVLGLFIMGALIQLSTSVNFSFVVSEVTYQDGTTVIQTMQDVLNSLIPGLVPLLLTFAAMKLLEKKVNPIYLIFGLFAVGIAGYALGLMS
ncbi:MAG TPA: PTS mannose transporter subunit IID [Erysipelothrix sp.]|nr:PTS mannose transporter subunit IID [Erysipelothrix sp.]